MYYLGVVQETVQLGGFGGELNVVRFNPAVLLLRFRHHERALVDKHRSPAVVQRLPQEALVAQPENKQVAALPAAQDGGRHGAHLRGRHSGRHIRRVRGGVMQERFQHRLGYSRKLSSLTGGPGGGKSVLAGEESEG